MAETPGAAVAYHIKHAELWQIGVTVHELLTGKIPFGKELPEKATEQQWRTSIEDALPYKAPEGMPPLAAELVCSLLVREPTQRKPLCQVYDHAWFASQLTADVAEADPAEEAGGAQAQVEVGAQAAPEPQPVE